MLLNFCQHTYFTDCQDVFALTYIPSILFQILSIFFFSDPNMVTLGS